MNCFACNKECFSWRQCGAGCSLNICYCNNCGGDARAAEEMENHVADEHKVGSRSIHVIEPWINQIKRLESRIYEAEDDAKRSKEAFMAILSRAEELGWKRPTLAINSFQSVLSWMTDLVDGIKEGRYARDLEKTIAKQKARIALLETGLLLPLPKKEDVW